jgi:ribosomal protein S18
LNRFHLPGLVTFPGFIGSSFFFLVPSHIFRVEGQGMWNFYLEFLIRRAKSKWISSLRESKIGATVMFSLLNACVMFGFVRKASKNFWFTSLRIEEKADKNNNEKRCDCVHRNLSCVNYWKKVKLFKYFVNLESEISTKIQTGNETNGKVCVRNRCSQSNSSENSETIEKSDDNSEDFLAEV